MSSRRRRIGEWPGYPGGCIAVGLILVLIVGGQDVAAGTLNWQSLMSLLIAVLAVYSPIVSLLQTYTTIRGVIPNLDRVERFWRSNRLSRSPECETAPCRAQRDRTQECILCL